MAQAVGSLYRYQEEGDHIYRLWLRQWAACTDIRRRETIYIGYGSGSGQPVQISGRWRPYIQVMAQAVGSLYRYQEEGDHIYRLWLRQWAACTDIRRRETIYTGYGSGSGQPVQI
jgi:hypothetical protein